MLTREIWIQKIEESGIRLFSASIGGNWTFESFKPEPTTHSEIFPFCIGDDVELRRGNAGPETWHRFHPGGEIWFADRYEIPSGTVIGVLFPKEYVPGLAKLDQPQRIPTGKTVSTSPGF